MINLEVCVKIKIMYNHYKDSKNLQFGCGKPTILIVE